MDQSILHYLWLNSKLYPGSPSAKLLLENLSDVSEAFYAGKSDYKRLDISPGDTERLRDKDLTDAKRYYEFCEKEHIGILTYDNPYYPGRLKAIGTPPPLLYYRGKVELLDDYPCFAMVGTRSCSEHGFRTAYRIAYEAAAHGAVVVNGLALGSDTACMKGALDAGGYAVGLLGCGIDRIYPSQNKELFYRLSRQGLILSEFAPFTRPEARNFPVRNRVISALSVAAVIFEANVGSGALITASHALNQGRRIFAVPGDVGDRLYDGPLALLKDGATIVTDASDILTEYSLAFPHRIKTGGITPVPPESEEAAVREAFAVLDTTEKAKARRLPKPYRPGATGKSSEKASEKSPEKASEKPSQKHVRADASSAPVKENTKSARTAKIASDAPLPAAERPQESRPALSETEDLQLSVEEKTILSYFEKQEILTVDEIAAKGMKTDDVLSSLTLLELFGYIHSLPGGRYEKQ